MLDPTMLYKTPGPHFIHGFNVDYVIVPAAEVAQYLSEGWHLTPTRAEASRLGIAYAPEELTETIEKKLASKRSLMAADAVVVVPVAPVEHDLEAPPTRAELEELARLKGIPFDGRTSDRGLAAKIKAAV